MKVPTSTLWFRSVPSKIGGERIDNDRGEFARLGEILQLGENGLGGRLDGDDEKAIAKRQIPNAVKALRDRKSRNGVVRIFDRQVEDPALLDVEPQDVGPAGRDGQRGHRPQCGFARVGWAGGRIYTAPPDDVVDRVAEGCALTLEIDESMELDWLFVAGRVPSPFGRIAAEWRRAP